MKTTAARAPLVCIPNAPTPMVESRRKPHLPTPAPGTLNARSAKQKYVQRARPLDSLASIPKAPPLRVERHRHHFPSCTSSPRELNGESAKEKHVPYGRLSDLLACISNTPLREQKPPALLSPPAPRPLKLNGGSAKGFFFRPRALLIRWHTY